MPDAPAMKVVHYYALARSHESGVTAAIRAWCHAETRDGMRVSVLCADGPVSQDYYGVPVETIRHFGRSRRLFLPFISSFAHAISEADILVLHEGWTISHYAAARIANRKGVPYFIMPHGVYESEVISGLKPSGRWRTAAERIYLEKASSVHLFFPSEVPLVQTLAARARTFCAPTGVDISTTPSPEGVQDAGYLLWYGRFDVHHKGLDLLLEAMSLIDADQRPMLRIAGYDYQNGEAQLRALITKLGIARSVSIEGSIRGSAKAQALHEARAYVHPSRWECHSIALLEALASGIPVLVGEGAHIASDLRETGTARVVRANIQAWRDAIAMIGLTSKANIDRTALWERLSWDASLSRTRVEFERAASANTREAPPHQ